MTPEAAPLELFGAEASREVAALLGEAGITLHTDAATEIARPRAACASAPDGRALDVDRIVSVPRLEGPSIAGAAGRPERLPGHDEHARVLGVPDVYAAGDVTASRSSRAASPASRPTPPPPTSPPAPARRSRRTPFDAGAARHAADRALGALHAPRTRRPRSPGARCGGRRPRSPAASSPATSRASTRPPGRPTGLAVNVSVGGRRHGRDRSAEPALTVTSDVTDHATRRLLDAGRVVVSDLDLESVLPRVLATAAEVTGRATPRSASSMRRVTVSSAS